MANLASKARAATGLSIREFAKLIRVAPRQVTRWEHGETEPTAAAVSLLLIVAAEPKIATEVLKRVQGDHSAHGFSGDGGPPPNRERALGGGYGEEGVPSYSPEFGYVGGDADDEDSGGSLGVPGYSPCGFDEDDPHGSE